MLTAPFKQWRKPNSVCLVNVVFVFLFSMLLSQIYTAVVEAVLAGIECYAKTSTESKVNEALILYIFTVDLLPYKVICKHPLPHMPAPPKKHLSQNISGNCLTLMRLTLWFPTSVSEFC